MTDDASPAGPSDQRLTSSGDAGRSLLAQFEFLPVSDGAPATVRAAGDIDLTNVGQFQAVLDEAATASAAITVDLTAVTYCDSASIRALLLAARQTRLTIAVSTAGPVTEILLKVSGLDQVATVVTLD